MKKLAILVAVIAVLALAPQTLALDRPETGNLTEQTGPPTKFDKKYDWRPGPILPGPPKKDFPVPPEPVRPGSVESSFAASPGLGAGSAATLESGGILSLPRSSGASRSPSQEARRSLRKLIRQLG